MGFTEASSVPSVRIPDEGNMIRKLDSDWFENTPVHAGGKPKKIWMRGFPLPSGQLQKWKGEVTETQDQIGVNRNTERLFEIPRLQRTNYLELFWWIIGCFLRDFERWALISRYVSFQPP